MSLKYNKQNQTYQGQHLSANHFKVNIKGWVISNLIFYGFSQKPNLNCHINYCFNINNWEIHKESPAVWIKAIDSTCIGHIYFSVSSLSLADHLVSDVGGSFCNIFLLYYWQLVASWLYFLQVAGLVADKHAISYPI